MPVQLNLSLDPPAAADDIAVRKRCASALRCELSAISGIRILKRSVDARQRNIKIILSVEVFSGDEKREPFIKPFKPVNVSGQTEVIIIGAGPAGLFAALRLIELGVRPVILERGREVPVRKRDIAIISREHVVNPDSNYCFGEGGAGTFSDGKLYTRSRKRGDNSRVLELLHLHGADENILYEAHPHLGTDKLPRIIKAVRQTILDAGGLLLFDRKVTDIIVGSGSVSGVVVAGGEKITSSYIILASGHSARDIYEICRAKNIGLEIKSFAMGVRVEHPQVLIDSIRYHGNSRGDYLPAASYSLVRQVDGRGVYSFCMCPGGFIVPSATSQQEVVVNGMSPSGRNSPYANSGIVVEIRVEDMMKYSDRGELAGIEFQRELEHLAWVNGGMTQRAPAQRLADFVSGKHSSSLPQVSYFPGVTSSPVHEWLPELIGKRLREGFMQFGAMMKGFLTNEAVILGVESRTSSPVRLTRNPATMEHINIKGLYPCGEGSGYAGGIVSSAVDGMKAAEAVAVKINEP
ncbi:MAG: FAD-dependent monooxygenase [Bacteroidales bacterium]|nr:FAD-dependent monooxygenase [Bacteroidales bacterium]